MASESNTYQIKSGDAPDAGAVTASAETIKTWLNDTNAPAVVKAADAYSSAASMIGLARESLLSAAKGLSEMWGGPTAALFQASLHKLDTTGDQLATKMKAMSTALNSYGATHLPEAIRKAEAIETAPPATGKSEPAPTPTLTTPPSPTSKPTSTSTPKPSPGPAPYAPGTDPAAEAKARRDQQARQILDELNKEIVSLYSQVPDDVSYDLDIPAPPGAETGYTPTTYSNPDRYPSSYRGAPPGTPTFDSGDGSTGGGINRPGGDGTGQTPGKTGPGSGDTGTGGDGSQNPDKPGTPPGTDTPPGGDPTVPGGNGDTGSGTGSGNGTGSGTGGDGTAPAVIGQDDGSRQTETASYRPTPPTNPMTPPPTTTPTTPYGQIQTTTPPTVYPTPGRPNTFVGPTSGQPGTPSVIGGGSMNGPNAMTAAASRGVFGAGTPVLPMGGMGAIGGAEASEDDSRSTDLREDRDPWTSPHEVTTHLLGGTGEA